MAKRKRYDDQMLLAPGEKVTGHDAVYIVDRVAGMGSFGAVYYARDPDLPDRRIALKEFYAPRHPRERSSLEALFEREQTVGKLASPHPLMPTFYESFLSEGFHYIAQEFIEGATLDEIIFKRHPIPREWTLKWAVSLCDALAFLHSRGVVHHDLKPANIRITPQGHLTLLDFGGAQYFGSGHAQEKLTEVYGTEGYLPPELEADGQWIADARTDIFALGCILYEMIAGAAPDQNTINERSMYVTNSLMQQPNADLELIRLINKALSYNTEYRYATANDFLLEVRKIAPPVLLVSKKHLRFGKISRQYPGKPLQITLYNAGGKQIQGEIKPRAPWITVHPTSFQGNKQDVRVNVDLSRISERDRLVSGTLEINTRNEMDSQGHVLVQGDRWFVECSVTVQVGGGLITCSEPQSVSLYGKRGQNVSGTFTLRNEGEQAAEVVMTPQTTLAYEGASLNWEGITIEPARRTIAPNETVMIRVSSPVPDWTVGNYSGSVTVRSASGQSLNVPLTLQVQSPMDAIRTLFRKR